MWNAAPWNGFAWNGSGAPLAVVTPPPDPEEAGAGLTTRFTWDGGEFAPLLMPRVWDPMTGTVGGRSVALSGIPASYLVRTDRMVTVTLRFWESEWLAFREMIAAGQSHLPITWYPDAEDEASARTVYLHSPALGSDTTPTRQGEFPRVMEATVTLRAVSGTPWRRFYS